VRSHIKNSDTGSISVETAILMPAFLGVLLVFISIVQIMSAEQILCASAVKTAEKMSKWAPIYKNLATEELKECLLNKVSGSLKEELSGEVGGFLTSILNLREITENSFDYIYSFTIQNLCEKYIKEDVFVKKGIVKINNLNLYKSSFFHGDSNHIKIRAECNVKTYLPFEVGISTVVNCAAWGDGVMPHIHVNSGTNSEISESIWEKDNFYRGKVIRQMYGANLPENFPVVAIYENSMVTMIKSINHTTETYQKSQAFEKTIKKMIDELCRFEGASLGEINIRKKDFAQKRLLLVCPENEFTVTQSKSLENLMSYAASKLIVLDLRRYQKI